MRIVGLFLSCLLLSSCATTAALNEKVNKSNAWEQPKVVSPDFFKRPENILKPPKAGKITVSVYKFSEIGRAHV